MRKVAYFSLFSLDHVVIFTYAITSPTAIFSLLAPYFRSQLLYIELYANVHFLMETQLFIDYSYINNLIFAKSPPPQFGKMPSPMSMFLSNCAILSANFLTFLADNKCNFEKFFVIFHYFSVLLSSTFLTFWTYEKCDFDLSFPWKTCKYAIFSSNCIILSAIFSAFLADNKCFFDFLLENGENVQTQTYHRSKNSKKYSTMKSQNTGIYQNTSQNHTY